jgi:hypothetical protein
MREHTEESPSLHDTHGDTAVVITPLIDETHVGYWQNIDAMMAEEQDYRSTHCMECGTAASGAIVGGVHHQSCDKCLRAALVEALSLIDAQHAA